MSLYDVSSANPRRLPILRSVIANVGGGTMTNNGRLGGTYSGILDVPLGGAYDDALDVYADSVTIENPTPLPFSIDVGSGEVIPPITRRNLRLGAIRQLPWHVAAGRPLNAGYNLNVVFNDPWSGMEDLYQNPIVHSWVTINTNNDNNYYFAPIINALPPLESLHNQCAVGALFVFSGLAVPGGLPIYQAYNYIESPALGVLPRLINLPGGVTGAVFVPLPGIVGIAWNPNGQPAGYSVDVTAWIGGS